MLALLDNGQDLDACAAEIGGEVGQLLTPLTRYRLRERSRPWAIDNGAYANFDSDAFMALLEMSVLQGKTVTENAHPTVRDREAGVNEIKMTHEEALAWLRVAIERGNPEPGIAIVKQWMEQANDEIVRVRNELELALKASK
jgi:hypothetical protein